MTTRGHFMGWKAWVSPNPIPIPISFQNSFSFGETFTWLYPRSSRDSLLNLKSNTSNKHYTFMYTIKNHSLDSLAIIKENVRSKYNSKAYTICHVHVSSHRGLRWVQERNNQSQTKLIYCMLDWIQIGTLLRHFQLIKFTCFSYINVICYFQLVFTCASYEYLVY